MTEQEAKSKWCPMVRFQIGPQDATWQGTAYDNRGQAMNGWSTCLCIASECMMWREDRNYSNGINTPTYVVIGGYCGLAGKL
jgi:hypothetical protein